MARDLSQCTDDMIFVNLSEVGVYYQDYFLWLPYEQILIKYILPILLSLGIVSNVSFIYVFVRIRRMRTVTNIYLVNLALSDLFFLIWAIGEKFGRFAASAVRYDQYGIGAGVWCVLIYSSFDIFFLASIFLVTLVSLEKYYAICLPIRHRLMSGQRRTFKLCTIAWLSAVVVGYALGIPSFLYFRYLCVDWPDTPEFERCYNVIGYCDQVSPIAAAILNGVKSFPFIIALGCNIYFYWNIVRSLKVRIGPQPSASKPITAQRLKMRNQVARLVIINGLVFFLLLGPYQFMGIVIMITGLTEKYLLDILQYEKTLWTFRVMTYINAIINPVIYTLLNKRYRVAYYEAFFCKGNRKSRKLGDTLTEDIEATVNENQIGHAMSSTPATRVTSSSNL